MTTLPAGPRSERDRFVEEKIQQDEQAHRQTAILVNPGDSATLLRSIAEAEEQSATITLGLGEMDQEVAAAQ